MEVGLVVFALKGFFFVVVIVAVFLAAASTSVALEVVLAGLVVVEAAIIGRCGHPFAAVFQAWEFGIGWAAVT